MPPMFERRPRAAFEVYDVRTFSEFSFEYASHFSNQSCANFHGGYRSRGELSSRMHPRCAPNYSRIDCRSATIRPSRENEAEARANSVTAISSVRRRNWKRRRGEGWEAMRPF